MFTFLFRVAVALGQSQHLVIIMLLVRFPWSHVEVSMGKILNPKLLLMCWSAPVMAATAISAGSTLHRFGQKCLLNVEITHPTFPTF